MGVLIARHGADRRDRQALVGVRPEVVKEMDGAGVGLEAFIH